MQKNNCVESNCSIYAELSLCFDNDFDVHTITEILGINQYDCKCRCETRISPLTGEHGPGYWSIKTKVWNTRDANPVIQDLMGVICGKEDLIRKVCKEHSGSAVVYLVPQFSSDTVPSFEFDEKFISFVAGLGGRIGIDIYCSPPSLLSQIRDRISFMLSKLRFFFRKHNRV